MKDNWIAQAIEQHRRDTEDIPKRILAAYESTATKASATAAKPSK